MKRLLLPSSLCLLCAILFVLGCKVKKEQQSSSETTEITEESKIDENGHVIPAPGTHNQKQLDSLKAIRNKEKGIKK